MLVGTLGFGLGDANHALAFSMHSSYQLPFRRAYDTHIRDSLLILSRRRFPMPSGFVLRWGEVHELDWLGYRMLIQSLWTAITARIRSVLERYCMGVKLESQIIVSLQECHRRVDLETTPLPWKDLGWTWPSRLRTRTQNSTDRAHPLTSERSSILLEIGNDDSVRSAPCFYVLLPRNTMYLQPNGKIDVGERRWRYRGRKGGPRLIVDTCSRATARIAILHLLTVLWSSQCGFWCAIIIRFPATQRRKWPELRDMGPTRLRCEYGTGRRVSTRWVGAALWVAAAASDTSTSRGSGDTSWQSLRRSGSSLSRGNTALAGRDGAMCGYYRHKLTWHESSDANMHPPCVM